MASECGTFRNAKSRLRVSEPAAQSGRQLVQLAF
jgi:hypothetical protein